jgi:hypothetical protein
MNVNSTLGCLLRIPSRIGAGSSKGMMHRMCSLCGVAASPMAIAGTVERLRKK